MARIEINLKAVFPGIAGAGDESFHAVHGAAGKVIVADSGQRHGRQRRKDFERARALDGQLGILLAGVLRFGRKAIVLENIGEILILIARVHAQKEMTRGKAVHQDIVHKSAVIGEQSGILNLAVHEPSGVVRGHMLDQCQRLRAPDINLPHVADVKKARGRAHRVVLGENAGIFHRHIPAAEIHHFGAQLAMDGVERGLAEGFSGGRGHTFTACVE